MIPKGVVFSPPLLLVDESENLQKSIISIKNNDLRDFLVNISLKKLDLDAYISFNKVLVDDFSEEEYEFISKNLSFDSIPKEFNLIEGTTKNIEIDVSKVRFFANVRSIPVIEVSVFDSNSLSDNNESINFVKKFYSLILYKEKLSEDFFVSNSNLSITEFSPVNSFVLLPENTFKVKIRNNTEKIVQPIGYIRVYNPSRQSFELASIVNKDLELFLPNQEKEFLVSWNAHPNPLLNLDLGRFRAELIVKPDYAVHNAFEYRSSTSFSLIPLPVVLFFVILLFVITFLFFKFFRLKIF